MLSDKIKTAIEARVRILESNNEYNLRQMEFLHRRLEDMRAQYAADGIEIAELKGFLANIGAGEVEQPKHSNVVVG